MLLFQCIAKVDTPFSTQLLCKVLYCWCISIAWGAIVMYAADKVLFKAMKLAALSGLPIA